MTCMPDNVFSLHGTISTWLDSTLLYSLLVRGILFYTANSTPLTVACCQSDSERTWPCTAVKLPTHTGATEHIKGMPFLFLGMGLFLTARRQNLYQKRLKAARKKEKSRRVWEISQSSDDKAAVAVVVRILSDQSVVCRGEWSGVEPIPCDGKAHPCCTCCKQLMCCVSQAS